MSTQVISRMGKPMTTPILVVSWSCRIAAAIILLQTLFFKFSAAKESVYIFSTLGIEPWGRIGSGIFELIASILLLVPSTVVLGALMALAAGLFWWNAPQHRWLQPPAPGTTR